MNESEIIQDVIDESNMEYASDGLLSPECFVEEKRRLIESLEQCLTLPNETWLTQEVVTQAAKCGVILDGSVLREVITSMVALRDGQVDELALIDRQKIDLKIEYVQVDLRQMKSAVDNVINLAISAAGESAAMMLKQQLEGFVLSDKLDEIIETEL